MSESKEEKKKKQKSVLREMSTTRSALLEASRIQKDIYKSIAMQSAMFSKAYNLSAIALQALARDYEQIITMALKKAVILAMVSTSQSMKAMMGFRESAQKLTEQYARIHQMIQRAVPMPLILPEVKAC